MMDFKIKFGISEEELNRSTTENHRKMIALKFGDSEAWEDLAIYIGVSMIDIGDIKVEYTKPRSRRLAMMRKWHELHGKDATYLRLVEGLMQIGRRDLIDRLIICFRRQYKPGYVAYCELLKYYTSSVISKVCAPLLSVLLIIIFFPTFYGPSIYEKFVHKNGDYDNITLGKNIAENHTPHSIRIPRIDHGLLNCTFPGHDLPAINPLFVGRENDVEQVLQRLARAHIVNINGAPGFGKSTLAIYVGYELFKNGTSVRYINMGDKAFIVMNQPQTSGGKSQAMPEDSNSTNVHQAHKSSLIVYGNFPLSASISQTSASSKSENLFEELRSWSKQINCTTILIFDNCEDALASMIRHYFLNLISTLVTDSHLKLHIIVVSNEKLFDIDSFDSWKVRELSQTASVKMLNELAPAIDNKTLTTAADLVDGCPLALKVIGQLLHQDGSNLIHKLKEELFAFFDKVDRPEVRFRVILDVAFNRLGVLKDCGRMLSLFPGSFDDRAGSAIVHKECWDVYLKHSFIDEYFHAFNYRYKMHRLIKQYLKGKISIDEDTMFKKKFRKHFETLLLTYYSSTVKQENEDVHKYTFSLELHNFKYLRELLMSEMLSSPEELAVLAYLFDMKLIQLQQIHRYYTHYIKIVPEVCPLLNQKLCGQMYTNIVRHLYQLCKCETLTAYFKQFFNSTCMEYFQCEIVIYLQSLHMSGVLQLLKNETSYINFLVTMQHCNYGKDNNWSNSIYTSYSNLVSFLKRALLPGTIAVMILFFDLTQIFGVIAISLFVICELILEYDIEVVFTHHIRILEIFVKCLCLVTTYSVLNCCIHLYFLVLKEINTRLSLSITASTFISFFIFMIMSYAFLGSYNLMSVCQFMPICI